MMQDNFATIQNRIQIACENHGRSLSEITLIWVSKTKPLQAVLEAQKCGAIHFGENKYPKVIFLSKRSCKKQRSNQSNYPRNPIKSSHDVFN